MSHSLQVIPRQVLANMAGNFLKNVLYGTVELELKNQNRKREKTKDILELILLH
jgi:hypothetical protein